ANPGARLRGGRLRHVASLGCGVRSGGRHDLACAARRRQRKGDGCPVAVETGVTRNLAAMQFDDLPAHVQADARAAGLAAALRVMMLETKELVEDPRTKRRRHAAA